MGHEPFVIGWELVDAADRRNDSDAGLLFMTLPPVPSRSSSDGLATNLDPRPFIAGRHNSANNYLPRQVSMDSTANRDPAQL